MALLSPTEPLIASFQTIACLYSADRSLEPYPDGTGETSWPPSPPTTVVLFGRQFRFVRLCVSAKHRTGTGGRRRKGDNLRDNANRSPVGCCHSFRPRRVLAELFPSLLDIQDYLGQGLNCSLLFVAGALSPRSRKQWSFAGIKTQE